MVRNDTIFEKDIPKRHNDATGRADALKVELPLRSTQARPAGRTTEDDPMKTLRRAMLALLLTFATAACSTSFTGPEHNPDGGHHNPDGGNHNPDGGNHNPDGGNHNPDGGNVTG